jgi:pyrrolidone-carboxylate peptidase
MSGILIYGFGPYDKHKVNVSGYLLERMTFPTDVNCEIFDVRFDRSMFIEAMKRHDPDIVIGLGQSARARKIRIERKAINLMGERGGQIVPIRKSGPDYYFSTLRIPRDSLARVSYDPGTYVCNYSMFVISEYCANRGKQFAFIHIPKAIDRKVAITFLYRLVSSIR